MDQERQQIVDLFKGLRVTDVNDAMDVMGHHDLGLMHESIRPLQRDTENLSHCFVGFAHTLRFVPTNRPVTAHTPEEMKEFISTWYRELARGPIEQIEEGDVIVIDGQDTNVGFAGSMNTFDWILRGAVGVVTNGAARDTDELIRQGVQVYCRRIRATIRPSRLEFDSEQVPIACGGVLVKPQDIVVADGDGVVVVPRHIAHDVAKYAAEIAEGDRKKRRELYEKAGLAMDDTVRTLAEVG